MFILKNKPNRINICTRCKSKIKKDAFRQIGNHRYCLNCVSPAGGGFPEYLVLRTPDLEDSSIYKSKVLTCARCKKEGSDPYLYDQIANHRFCHQCAKLKLSELNPETQSLEENPDLFYYPIFNREKELKYWETEIDNANLDRQRNPLPTPHNISLVDVISIKKQDTTKDRVRFNQISLHVYANSERTAWCFKLINDFESGWDGMLVYMGGYITPEQFLEYLHKMFNHHYDALFEAKI